MNYSELMNVFEECREELMAIGIDTMEGIVVSSMKSTVKWGECKWKRTNRTTRIEIRLNVKLYDGTTDSLLPLKNTIIHELLHSVVPYAKHGYDWQRLADKVKQNYPQYDIKRATSSKEFGIDLGGKIKQPSDLYVVRCEKCGKVIKTYQRFSKTLKNLSHYKHSTDGGNVYLAQTPKGIQVLSVKRSHRAV